MLTDVSQCHGSAVGRELSVRDDADRVVSVISVAQCVSQDFGFGDRCCDSCSLSGEWLAMSGNGVFTYV